VRRSNEQFWCLAGDKPAADSKSHVTQSSNVAKSAGDGGDAAKTLSRMTAQDSDAATLTGCAESNPFYGYLRRGGTLELEAALVSCLQSSLSL